MKIVMSGIDYNDTPINLREMLSFSAEKISKLNRIIYNEDGVFGCTIISTCNRTEIYLSCDDNFDNNADKLLIEKCNLDYKIFEKRFYLYENIDAVKHLIELGCGLKSQILGESQIVGQINNAVKLSRDSNCTDACLETLFRIAVTAGKEALTKERILNVPSSASAMAVNMLNKIYDNNLRDKKCLVIGNGKMGRLAEKLLVDNYAEVYVTLRSYKHGETIVPYGCKTIPYKDRFEIIDGCDIVISATTSSHYTINFKDMNDVIHKPNVIIDLAVPRDIDPEIEKIKEIKLFNIDDFKTDNNFNKKEIDNVYKIVEKYISDYYKWENYKKCIPQINDIKSLMSARICESESFKEFKCQSPDIYDVVNFSVSKAVEIIMGGIKDDLRPKTIKKLKNKIEERARL